MRLAKFTIGLLVVIVLFASFVVTSRQRDEMPKLRPYISSQSEHYFKNVPFLQGSVYARKIQVHDLSVDQAFTLIGGRRDQDHDFEMRIADNSLTSIPTGRQQVVEIIWSKSLRWNEVLFLRITHLDRNPFTKWKK